MTHRNSASLTSFDTRASTCLATAQLTEYQFRIGSVLMPQSKVRSRSDNTAGAGWGSEYLMELLRSFHKLGGAGQQSAITLGSWTRATSSVRFGSFCVGLELESFANKNDVM